MTFGTCRYDVAYEIYESDGNNADCVRNSICYNTVNNIPV
jgi:hypothetical protein